MKNLKVLVSDAIAEAAVREMKEAGLDVTVKTGLKPEQVCEMIAPFDVIVVRSATKVTDKVIEAAKNLKLIVRAGVGLDNVNTEAAAAHKIRVENTPHATTTTVAEHTFALLLALARRLPQAHASMQRGEWDRKSFTGIELKGKTIGIVGLGRIGQEVAKRAKAFGMHVETHDQTVDPEVAEALDIELKPLDEVVQQSDIISVHLPLTPETHHLFNLALLKTMKKGAYLINASRGGIVDEDALIEVLSSGHLAGAAVDVFEMEPPSPEHPLLKMKQVIAAPHLGAMTEEGQVRAGHEAARIIIEFAQMSLRA